MAKNGTTEKDIAAQARERMLALAFLCRSDMQCFGALWADLENQYTHGNNQYPADLTAAYSLLVNYRGHCPATGISTMNQGASTVSPPPATGSSTATSHGANETTAGMTFAQNSANPVAGTDGELHKHITCFTCQRKGHYVSMCPGTTAAVQMLQMGEEDFGKSNFTFAQEGHTIPKTWVLLDSQSTVSIFCNPKLLQNIRPSLTTMMVYSKGEAQQSNMIGNLRNFGPIWFHPSLLANILSLAENQKKCHITMDTDVEPALCVHWTNGAGVMKFTEYATGLYVYDTAMQQAANHVLMSSVEANKAMFTKREVEAAERAQELYRKLGRPSPASVRGDAGARSNPELSDHGVAKRAVVTLALRRTP